MIKTKRILFCLALCFSTIGGRAQGNSVVAYPAPDGATLLDEYAVEVRTTAGEWQSVPTYGVKVDCVEKARHNVKWVSMAYFDFSGTVEVRVSKRKGTFAEAAVRPLSYCIQPTRSGNAITFSLSRPMNLSVEFDGDRFNNLHLFANPIDQHKPQRTKGRHLVYFGSGIHQLAGDTLRVKSGQTVYVAGGAVVRGTLLLKGVHDVNVYGRGEIHPEGRGAGIEVANCQRVNIDGVIVTQCPVGGSDSVSISNVKAISSYGWGDGLNVFASSNVSYDGVFCRTSDDCTTVYATRAGFTGGCKNISMRRSVLWADVAHPIFIGLHGNVERPDTIENVTYDDIDILDENELQIDYQGCLAINAGDDNLVRNVRFSNIRVENIRRGQLVSLRICYNQKYCKAPGRGIENVLFRNISFTGAPPELSIIAGYDDNRKVKNITFEHLTINGQAIFDDMPNKPKWYKTADMARFFIGEHTENIVFKP